MNYHISKSNIFLQDIHFHAFHGVFEQERKVGNDFRIDIKLTYDITKACLTDNLDETISYADVYQILKEEMDKPSLLLEHVAHRIVQHLFESLQGVDEIYLCLAKRNPPMGADIKEAGIEMTCKRNNE